ncbi:hypothetical protein [Massilia aquatica]|uniref:Uncharacterized protein n=1 Tax=Massilia aquatica TaxID=2609000 RepID=A0ABX0M6G4_9BURK|nr:hypothetical protein [Massilia aquatica]NHZ42821.1 hypothetical protein [Massilia aquatica]
MVTQHLQNRVDPWGQLRTVASRGTRMGNRGILHNDANQIVRPWKHKRWVTCMLEFKQIKRPKPFSRGNYSELFFLDEATAFAAGHRPCGDCQKARHLDFKEKWLAANVDAQLRSALSMDDVDIVLHAERCVRGGGKTRFAATLGELPKGTMFEFDAAAFLVTAAGYLPWSFDGYGPAKRIDGATAVTVLTPASIVRAFEQGFVALVHASAGLDDPAAVASAQKNPS